MALLFAHTASFTSVARYRDELHNQGPPLAVVCFFIEVSRPLILVGHLCVLFGLYDTRLLGFVALVTV